MPIQKGPANLGTGSVDSTELSNTLDLSAKTVTYRTIVAGDIASNAITTAKITDANITTAKVADTAITPAKMANSGAELGMRNRIINGAMVIDQRNAGASITAIGGYTLDRWMAHENTDGDFTVQQVTTAPAGFNYSIKATVTTADSSIGSTQNALLCQYIEGYNVGDFNFGSSNAKTITLSFWVNCAVTGTFTGTLQNSAADRSYPFSYTISSANTWEQKSITIAGDQSGTWLTTNGVGLRVWFTMAVGSGQSTTAGAWASGTYYGATGQVNWMATVGNTFYITGVQLEKGSTASPFEYRPYTTELQLCQRYFLRYGQGTIVGSGASDGGTNLRVVNAITPVSMRAAPSYAWNNVYTYSGNLSNYGFTGVGSTVLGPSSVKFDATTSSSGPTNAMLTVICDGSSSYFTMSAEL